MFGVRLEKEHSLIQQAKKNWDKNLCSAIKKQQLSFTGEAKTTMEFYFNCNTTDTKNVLLLLRKIVKI